MVYMMAATSFPLHFYSYVYCFFHVFCSGYIRKSFGGEKVLIENMFGMGEDFYLRA